MGYSGDNRTLAELRVLAVDDHPVNRSFLRAVLGRRVRQLSIASSGHEAIALAAEQDFDLLLLDLHMPDLDGYSTWERIRAAEPAVDPIVVALTADHRADARARARDAGFRGYIEKPVGPARLIELLERIAAGHDVLDPPEHRRRAAIRLLDDARGRKALGSSIRLTEMRRAFVAELEDGLVELERKMISEPPEAQARLHQWIGAGGYVGAPRFTEEAGQLRSALESGDAERIGPAWLRFRRCTRATLDALAGRDSG